MGKGFSDFGDEGFTGHDYNLLCSRLLPLWDKAVHHVGYLGFLGSHMCRPATVI